MKLHNIILVISLILTTHQCKPGWTMSLRSELTADNTTECFVDSDDSTDGCFVCFFTKIYSNLNLCNSYDSNQKF